MRDLKKIIFFLLSIIEIFFIEIIVYSLIKKLQYTDRFLRALYALHIMIKDWKKRLAKKNSIKRINLKRVIENPSK